jgi:hypothetical protein
MYILATGQVNPGPVGRLFRFPGQHRPEPTIRRITALLRSQDEHRVRPHKIN